MRWEYSKLTAEDGAKVTQAGVVADVQEAREALTKAINRDPEQVDLTEVEARYEELMAALRWKDRLYHPVGP